MESVVASLSASECLGYLQGASLDANALAQLRAVLGDAARQDPSLRARLEALAPAASPPPASPPPAAAAADGGDLAAFLATAGLERFAAPLARAGVPSLAALLAAPGDALKDLRDPETGARVLPVGPQCALRGALKDWRASVAPRRSTPYPASPNGNRIEIQNNQLAMPPNYWAASPASPAFSVESPGLKTSPYGGGSP